MPYQWTPYVLPMIAGAVLSTLLALFTWQRSRISKSFSFLTLALAEWSAAYVMELISTQLATKLIWAQVQYAGIVVVPVAWLVFALRYGDQTRPIRRRTLVLLSIIPAITALLTWTNDLHHLILQEATLKRGEVFTVLDVTRGPWFWVHVTYSYTLIIMGSILFVGKLLQFSRTYRRQVILLLLGALIPWVVNVFYVLGVHPVANLDLTPFALTLSCLIIVWGILRFRLLDVVPIAHDTVIESMQDGVMVLDTYDRILDLNPAAVRILPHSNEAWTGQPITCVIPDWPTLVTRHHEGPSTQTDIRFGEEAAQRIYDLRIQPLFDPQKRVHGRLVILHDITERERARNALRDRERFLAHLHTITRAALETPDLATMREVLTDRLRDLFDADGCTLTLWDDATETTRPRTVNSTSPVPPPSGLPVSAEAALTTAVLHAERPLALDDVRDTPHLDPDPVDAGPIRSLLGLPLIAGDETLGAALITFQTPHPFTPEDIARGKQVAGQVALAMARAELVAELQRYAQDLEARNEELSAFAQTVAHDIKSPLGTLVGSADLLNQAYEALSPEDRHRLTEGILQTGNKITNIVDELLLLAEVRKGDVTQAPLDLDGIVRDARARVAPLIAQTHAEVIVPERWPAALGHGPWVEEVWVNYLSNAIKYGGDPEAGVPPRVELGYDEAEAAGSDVRTCVRFWVRDNGPGLTEAAQAHLFAPFTRLDQARAEGHGLGLSIVRRIVDKLGGDVDVESQVGQGSTFSFTLPAPDEKAS
jgi:PAS domain S-box-containing protein